MIYGSTTLTTTVFLSFQVVRSFFSLTISSASSPSPRSEISATLVGDMMFIVGSDTSTDQLWAYDILNNNWTMKTSLTSYRYRQSAIYSPLRHSLIIFGGRQYTIPPPPPICYGDVLEYNITTDSWSSLLSNSFCISRVWEHITTEFGWVVLRATQPNSVLMCSHTSLLTSSSLNRHAAVYYKNSMYVFGGTLDCVPPRSVEALSL